MNYSISQIGADVEVFLRHAKTNEPVPVCGLLGGTKENPQYIGSWGAGDSHSAVQEDNVMPEFNIRPQADPMYFSKSTKLVMDYLHKHFKEEGLVVAIEPSMVFEPKQLESKQAQTVGCDPDFNAWNMQRNQALDPKTLGCVRTAGGHIHVSFHVNGKLAGDVMGADGHQSRMIRMLDLMLGVPSVLLDRDTRRKQFYGKAGAYRKKHYGVEYRVLSNFWIKSDELRIWVANQVYKAVTEINMLYEEGEDGNLPVDTCKRIIQCINTNDISLAQSLIDDYQIECPK
jgi:hypothetical protein